tara:strand:- start:7974 stop:8192 length:219 start_codon:yes stop_codon:yes gene_type:complete
MFIKVKKLLFIATFNLTLFLILMIGIQNNYSRKKVNLIVRETILLPISFIIGASFISGSLTGSLLNMHLFDD